MREFRLRSLEIYHSLDVPPWGPSIDDLNIDNIVTYVKPNTDMQGSWKMYLKISKILSIN